MSDAPNNPLPEDPQGPRGNPARIAALWFVIPLLALVLFEFFKHS